MLSLNDFCKKIISFCNNILFLLYLKYTSVKKLRTILEGLNRKSEF